MMMTGRVPTAQGGGDGGRPMTSVTRAGYTVALVVRFGIVGVVFDLDSDGSRVAVCWTAVDIQHV